MVAGDGVEPPKIQVLSLVNYPLFYPAPEKIGGDAGEAAAGTAASVRRMSQNRIFGTNQR